MTTLSQYRVQIYDIEGFAFEEHVKRMSVGPVRLRAHRYASNHGPNPITASMNVVARSEKSACQDALHLLDKVREILDYTYIFNRGRVPSANSVRTIEVIGRRHIPSLTIASGNAAKKIGTARVELTALANDFLDINRLVPSLVLNRTMKGVMSLHYTQELTTLILDVEDIAHQDVSHKDCVAGIAAALYRLHDSIHSGMRGNGSEQPFLTAIMGLEALFAPPTVDEFRPVSSTVALGAAYTSLACNTGEDRMARWQEVKKLYVCRSRIAHGTSSHPPSELDVVRARRILAESIEYCVAHLDEICAAGGLNSWLEIRGINGN